MKRKGGSGANPKDMKSKKAAEEEFGERRYDRTYEYVQGGFQEKLPPQQAGNQTSMYAAFDRALRASSYNMFCSPLKPVNAPTPYKGQAQAPSSSSKIVGDDVQAFMKGLQQEERDQEDEEEKRKRIESEYAALNSFLKMESRDGESTRQLKLMNSAGKKFGSKKVSPPTNSKVDEKTKEEKKIAQAPSKIGSREVAAEEEDDGKNRG
eukprot:753483-Hanusia_phi.AAC.1